MTAPVYVGIDGGGTRSRAAVMDAGGRVIARAEGGAGLVTGDAPAAGAEALDRLLLEALEAARAAPPAAALCCGLAGAGRQAERAELRTALERRGNVAVVRVVGDMEAAFHDAFGGAPGLLLIAGTGSIACGRGFDGSWHRVGGWGSLLGDEGSGYALGLEGLRAVLRAHDARGPATTLAAELLSRLGLDRPEALVAWSARATKAEIAALAPAVIAAADAADDVAEEVVGRAVRQLVDHVQALTPRIAGQADPAIGLALAGGLLRPGGPLRQRVIREVVRVGPAPSVLDVDVDAARGAASMAREAVAVP